MELNPIQQLEAVLPDVLNTRYLTIAGLTVLLWDHCLTFEQERRHIWAAEHTFIRLAFLCNRYIVPAILIFQTHLMSGLSSVVRSDSKYMVFFILETHLPPTNSCWGWIAVSAVIAIVSIAVSHGLVLLKLWKLWEGQRTVALITVIVFAVTETGSVIFMLLSVSEEWPGAVYNVALHMCAITHKPAMLPGVWICTITLEFVAFVLVCLNALSRPRDGDVFLMRVMHRDGMLLFLAISALGWLNLAISVTAPPSRIFLGVYCIWALVTTIVSRMMINAQEAEEKSVILGY